MPGIPFSLPVSLCVRLQGPPWSDTNAVYMARQRLRGRILETSIIICMLEYWIALIKNELHLFCTYLEECPRYILSEIFKSS